MTENNTNWNIISNKSNDKYVFVVVNFGTDYKYLPDNADAVTLIPNGETTIEERFKVINQISNDLGLGVVRGVTPASVSPLEYGENIDVANNVDGDANNDKITSIADAAAIMQAIANPDKYALSDLGEFNADFACDGLTVDDAVAIQKKLAGID